RSGADVQYRLPRPNHVGRERITHARERFDGGGRNRIQLGLRVTDEETGGPPGREMERLLREARDLRVHPLDGLHDAFLLLAQDGDHGLSSELPDDVADARANTRRRGFLTQAGQPLLEPAFELGARETRSAGVDVVLDVALL